MASITPCRVEPRAGLRSVGGMQDVVRRSLAFSLSLTDDFKLFLKQEPADEVLDADSCQVLGCHGPRPGLLNDFLKKE